MISSGRLFRKFFAASLIHVDEIAGGDGLLRLDIHRHLPQVQLIQPLKNGHTDAGPPDEHLALLFEAGDDVGLVGRGLDVTAQNDDEHHCHRHNNVERGENVFQHGDSSFQITTQMTVLRSPI